MKKQKMRNKWTKENLNYLKNAYIQGSPLKQIAANLDRSVSAVNKVLARYNFRTHQRINFLPTLPLPTPHQIQQKKDIGAKIRKINSDAIKFFHPDHRQWVLFDSVVLWLREQKIFVIKSRNDNYYEINGYPKSKEQILFIANLCREQQQLPAFFVKGVTYL
ncbi:MAG: hypothetical protein FJX71_03515 [Alphaproteobacteria bacterium]|nr:hypothetical protein [Alphaproteobacteria bacterium]